MKTLKRKVPVTIIYRKLNKLNEFEFLPSNSAYLQVRQFKGFHAKIYLNEDRVIDTSLNLLKYSMEHNVESGNLFEKSTNPELYSQYVEEYYNLYEESKLELGKGNKIIFGTSAKRASKAKSLQEDDEIESISTLSKTKTTSKRAASSSAKASKTSDKVTSENKPKSKTKPTKGFCMDCGKSIRFSIKKPCCPSCMEYWDNSIYADKTETQSKGYCHICGEKTKPKFNRPVCPTCFREHKDWM